METKPTARELLKEARDALADIYGEPGKTVGGYPCMLNLIAQIDAYLAAPSESAMEVVRKIRSKTTHPEYYVYDLPDIDAAALIEGLQRGVIE